MIEEFRRYREYRHQQIRNWKQKNGKKVIGVFCCSVPEELIHAADMLPVRILGEQEETTEANLHLPTNVCPYVKSCFDQALKGKYDYLDGLVVPNVCDIIRAMYGFWKNNLKLPYIRFLEIPQKISNEATTFFARELASFKESLEEFSGKEITEKALAHSIEVYNENRALLRRVYELRRIAAPLISGVEAQDMVISSMLMPKEGHNQMLRLVLEQVEGRPPKQGVRLFISANMLDNTDFLELIEECGGNVVADDMPMGSRYFFSSVARSNDPLAALAERYLDNIPCPRKMLPKARLSWVTKMLEGFEVQGAIIRVLRACDCHLYEYPYLQEHLKGLGLPVIFFRGEEVVVDKLQERNQMKAFIEMVGG